MWQLDAIFRNARRFGASDIHLVRGVAPIYRINGEIRPVEGAPLSKENLDDLLHEMTSERQRKTLEEKLALCFSSFWNDVGRFRASVYYHALCPEMSIRLCETKIRTLAELGLPEVIGDFSRLPNGLVLVTGPTGVGKTTTLNVIVDMINQEQRKKVIMIEDPVEFVHRNSRSIIVQQEVLTDTLSFQSALLNSLRQDPDVIVVGEMRSLETIETALTAAETGHLVLATLHTPDSVQTIQRIQSAFPPEQQNFINLQLANSLQAIISQKLLPRANGNGRVLACEVCIATFAVRNKIRERNTHLIYNDLQAGRASKMLLMDTSLLELYERGEITYDTAMNNARDQKYLKLRVGESAEE